MSFSGKPTTVVEQTIENNGFWPDLSLAEYQKAYRLPGEYLSEVLVTQLELAMVEVNQDLARVEVAIKAAGVTCLEDGASPGSVQGWGYAAKVSLYKRAVYCRAKATALTDFATVTRRDVAENTGKEAPERADTYLAFSQQAVRALQGRSRITAALL
ncbi:head completion/stabilization protein [Pseudomonas sp. SWRI51]|uniref:head completion/stabilization protein n=1 Tax=Pseudomonas sp. SWRI51 TaxID=2745491 RepID=UPI00164487E3|nr:head completion/stabilization protein [Pseudomonas sp. SWRI51]MBC3410079.1 head completion/stabilization protein [Pseudomonas sp. SWRI51]